MGGNSNFMVDKTVNRVMDIYYININIYFLCADVDVTYSSNIMEKDL